jgi:hypothetical protein
MVCVPVGVTVKDMQDHIGELFSKFNLRILVNGNMDESVCACFRRI